jgi:hypothetical protein
VISLWSFQQLHRERMSGGRPSNRLAQIIDATFSSPIRRASARLIDVFQFSRPASAKTWILRIFYPKVLIFFEVVGYSAKPPATFT